MELVPQKEASLPGKDIESQPNNVLRFNVSFSVGDRKILTDAYGELHSGDCLAIMGPSGAGKTTLLSALTLDTHGGRSEGEVTLNGLPMTGALFKKRCTVVNQEDYHWAMLTCRETITYAADLYLGLKPAETKRVVDDMIKRTGLESCEDVIVGNAFTKGLSGGQKRRLSVAVALLKKLDVIYLDEPTSGLDSASAASIMSFITQVTKDHKLISLTTIHQPATAVYNGFDKVMILSKGRMAYCGKAGDEALKYFANIGHPIGANMNPADFMVDLVNADFHDEDVVNNILTNWSTNNPPLAIGGVAENDHRTEELEECTLCRQTIIMFDRHMKLSYRDPLLFVGRMGIFLSATIFFAIIYVAARDAVQDQVLNRMWYVMWCIGVPSNMAVIAVHTYNSEFFAVKREAKNGMIHPISYLVAMSVIQIPIMILFAIFALSVGAYGIIDFNGEHYGQVILIYACCIYCFEAFAQVFSVAFENPLMGMLNFMQVWFASFLFAGVMIPLSDVVYPFKLFGYIMPLKYALKAIIYQEFIDQDWKGAELCDPQTDTTGFCYSYGSKTGPDEGWTCGPNNELCYGKTGEQVLDQLSRSFTSFTSVDSTVMDVVYILIITLVLKVIHTIMAVRKCNVEDVIHRPGSAVAKKA